MAKGEVNISQMFDYEKKSGMKHFFVEQEKYSTTPFKVLSTISIILEKQLNLAFCNI